MKNLIYLVISLSLISIIFTSCEKELLGCMDSAATNYNNLANTDDGSCIYPPNWSELALGTWNFDPNCDAISIPVIGDILIGKEIGEGVFGVSFKMKGPPGKIKTTVNPIKTLTPRFITRALEKRKKKIKSN